MTNRGLQTQDGSMQGGPHRHVTRPGTQGPTLGSIFHCHHLEILKRFYLCICAPEVKSDRAREYAGVGNHTIFAWSVPAAPTPTTFTVLTSTGFWWPHRGENPRLRVSIHL